MINIIWTCETKINQALQQGVEEWRKFKGKAMEENKSKVGVKHLDMT